MKRVAVLAVVLALVGVSGAGAAAPACSTHKCKLRFVATPRVKRWSPQARIGERWALYLNVYVGGKRLAYERLPGQCVAAYTGPKVAVRLRACGSRPFTLEYVSFAGKLPLRVQYRYIEN